MTHPPAVEAGPPSGVGSAPATPRAVVADLRAAVSIVLGLAVIGGLLGVVWAAWSPPGPRALVLGPGLLQADETESFVAGDGRFLVLSAAAGLLAGLLAWRRRNNRGPLVIAALAVGGLAGSLLMELVGRLSGGGTNDGKTNTIIAQLPLTLHMQGLLFVQAGLAVLVYGVLVSFTSRDDLGRPDPERDELLRARTPYGAGYPPPYATGYPPPDATGYPPPDATGYPPPYAQYPPQPFVAAPADPPVNPRPRPAPSVRPGDQPQDGGGHGDAPGVLQQRDLPPQ